jgi:hypothetical protein
VPESKHRRKNKNRKRPRHMAQPVPQPPPSAPWVPRVGVGLLGLGVLVIILSYVPAVRDAQLLSSLPWIGANWGLVLGFVSLTAGFGVLTRWR